VMVMGAYNLIWIPYGTALGVLALIVLASDEARAEFASGNRPRAT